MSVCLSLLRNCRATTAAEFALVLPLLMLLLFGIIDGGRFLWECNRAEKATQAGVRFAAVTGMVPSALASYQFTVGTEVTQVTPGIPVPIDSFRSVTCTSTSCENVGAGPTPGFDATAWAAILARMQAMYPAIGNANFTITYENVGLGYAGDPYGPDVAPLITIKLQDLTFTPITSLLFATVNMPDFRASMTLEDGIGRQSN